MFDKKINQILILFYTLQSLCLMTLSAIVVLFSWTACNKEFCNRGRGLSAASHSSITNFLMQLKLFHFHVSNGFSNLMVSALKSNLIVLKNLSLFLPRFVTLLCFLLLFTPQLWPYLIKYRKQRSKILRQIFIKILFLSFHFSAFQNSLSVWSQSAEVSEPTKYLLSW